MIKYLIVDVDGTLTDGGIYYDEKGNELKKFCTKDGTGIICALAAGIEIVILTGRECAATTRRMTELGISNIHQGVKNKFYWIKNWMEESNIDSNMVGYIGDDVNDLAPMELCSYVACPADAASDIKTVANYISSINGGYGVIRDCVEHILKKEGIWYKILGNVYGKSGC